MSEEEKRRLLTQTVEIPQEVLKELSTDGGIEGIKAIMVKNGWDKSTPMALMVHALDEAGTMEGSRWMMLVSTLTLTCKDLMLINRGRPGRWQLGLAAYGLVHQRI